MRAKHNGRREPASTINMHTTIIVMALLALTSSNANADPAWTYAQQNDWSQNYVTCSGEVQSPINIPTDATTDTLDDGLEFGSGYSSSPNLTLRILNDGQRLVVSLNSTNTTGTCPNLTISGGGLAHKYKLYNADLHWGENSSVGSEHKIGGTQYSLELHLVHYNTNYSSYQVARNKSNGLVTLAIFYEETEQVQQGSVQLNDLLSAAEPLPTTNQTKVTNDIALDMLGLLPQDRSFYAYKGSITHPPCSENVVWIVFKHALKISSSNMAKLRNLKSRNYRTTQTLGERTIKEYDDDSQTNTASKRHQKRKNLPHLEPALEPKKKHWYDFFADSFSSPFSRPVRDTGGLQVSETEQYSGPPYKMLKLKEKHGKMTHEIEMKQIQEFSLYAQEVQGVVDDLLRLRQKQLQPQMVPRVAKKLRNLAAIAKEYYRHNNLTQSVSDVDNTKSLLSSSVNDLQQNTMAIKNLATDRFSSIHSLTKRQVDEPSAPSDVDSFYKPPDTPDNPAAPLHKKREQRAILQRTDKSLPNANQHQREVDDLKETINFNGNPSKPAGHKFYEHIESLHPTVVQRGVSSRRHKRIKRMFFPFLTKKTKMARRKAKQLEEEKEANILQSPASPFAPAEQSLPDIPFSPIQPIHPDKSEKKTKGTNDASARRTKRRDSGRIKRYSSDQGKRSKREAVKVNIPISFHDDKKDDRKSSGDPRKAGNDGASQSGNTEKENAKQLVGIDNTSRAKRSATRPRAIKQNFQSPMTARHPNVPRHNRRHGGISRRDHSIQKMLQRLQKQNQRERGKPKFRANGPVQMPRQPSNPSYVPKPGNAMLDAQNPYRRGYKASIQPRTQENILDEPVLPVSAIEPNTPNIPFGNAHSRPDSPIYGSTPPQSASKNQQGKRHIYGNQAQRERASIRKKLSHNTGPTQLG